MIKLIKTSFYHEKETKERLIDFIRDAEYLSMGKQCFAYEAAFAAKQGRKHAVFVSSGSMANLILIQSLLNMGLLQKGDRVGVSSLTWATNIMPVLQLGLVPVAIDSRKETLNVSVAELKKAGPMQALFLTNVLGFSDDIDAIRDYCAQEKILFIEDNCEALGTVYKGTLLGNFGLASTFSFFVGHHLSTIEGGMICTDDDDLHDMMVMVRAHGWDRNLSKDAQQKLRDKNQVADFFAKYTFYDLSFNGRPTEINGFLGNEQLQYWDEIVGIRDKNYRRFHAAISQNDDFIAQDIAHLDIVSNFAVPVLCKDQATFEKYRRAFEAMEVEIRPVIAGDITEQPFYKKYVTVNSQYCENAAFIHKYGFYFGNNPELTEDECQTLVDLLSKD